MVSDRHIPSQERDDPANDFRKRCHHVAKLLRFFGLNDDANAAAAWVVAFVDDEDPTFAVEEWVNAGWRDPRAVSIALHVCGDRLTTERCIAWLGLKTNMRGRRGLSLQLAAAMLALRSSN